ncbi:dienelactone hydrolase family protein [Actinoplanes sp. TRM 88003]|uniref:Dienelactone hydrolase family protein n=1 Tax=Paractinoplanes aksuensis TaxID=2939490 RepID=A0ABT1DMT1_9ACTN|nr:dienelactone hydrolase family protein [Actinoplanes aksuensis]MCO8272152.1 dienelactone hydrolase family protein [Actinoplanes aksuensis]
MASVAIFHSAYGLRPSVHAAAGRMRAAGHTVVTPDLYGLPPADSLDQAAALADKVGWPEIVARGRAALRDMPPRTVLAGFSMGTGVVDALLAERPHTAGLLLLGGAPAGAAIPAGLRAQLHVADPDPEFVPAPAVTGWADAMDQAGAIFEVYRYPAVGHLWMDEDLPDHDELATDLLWSRCSEFLRLSGGA